MREQQTQPGLDALASFFRRLGSAPHRGLLLDFDGTIAPFAADRSLAAPYPGIRSRLRALVLAPRPTRVAIVSGRGLADLRARAAIEPPVELWGSHGLEHLTADGREIFEPPPERVVRLVEEVGAAFAAQGLSEILERKPYGVAIHRRGNPPELFERARRELLERFASPAADAGLQRLAFDGGVELRMAGSDKGIAVRAMLAELGEDAAVAYLGDDLTDEDAFATLDDRGLTVLVRETLHPTRARAWIRPPDELFRFLAAWSAAIEGRAA
ncbi:MAG TPA: trehalose-phosphatase [Thermoanaerobaculia bacterium]|jgi:trehalose-phosphatase